MQSTDFEAYLAEEVKKYKGIYVPVRSGFLRRMLVNKVPIDKLHPNPDDEFSMPDIGPNYEIISNYESRIRDAARNGAKDCFDEPLIVERIRPDGYIILNGHHRWAAAWRCRLKKVPVEIVNLTQEMDVKQMLWNSSHDKRAALDLDEAVFCAGDEPAEKPLSFPFNRIYRRRLRLGIPALFRFLGLHGYDIWVYSADYYSLDYIRELFGHYHVSVTGIVTGTARKRPKGAEIKGRIDSLIAEKYPVTLSIDSKALLRIDERAKTYEEFELSGSAADWSAEVMEGIKRFEKQK